MTMSTDRVRFKFNDNPKQEAENVAAAARAFGISRDRAMTAFRNEGTIVCRPSQFARFIIYRIEEGVTCNRIAQLQPTLFHEVEGHLDVSKNPAKGV